MFYVNYYCIAGFHDINSMFGLLFLLFIHCIVCIDQHCVLNVLPFFSPSILSIFFSISHFSFSNYFLCDLYLHLYVCHCNPEARSCLSSNPCMNNPSDMQSQIIEPLLAHLVYLLPFDYTDLIKNG